MSIDVRSVLVCLASMQSSRMTSVVSVKADLAVDADQMVMGLTFEKHAPSEPHGISACS